jgi:nucleotide-binding universal stress UspA family protein
MTDDEAKKESSEDVPEEQQLDAKVLVVGTQASFSQRLVEYAIWFAKRMEYGVVGLNCVPFGREAPDILSPYQTDLQKEFDLQAAAGAELLAYRAGTEDVSFQHLVKFGAPDRCIKEAHQEVGGIEFVIVEPDACPEVDMETAIPVFSYDMG